MRIWKGGWPDGAEARAGAVPEQLTGGDTELRANVDPPIPFRVICMVVDGFLLKIFSRIYLPVVVLLMEVFSFIHVIVIV